MDASATHPPNIGVRANTTARLNVDFKSNLTINGLSFVASRFFYVRDWSDEGLGKKINQAQL